MKIVSVLSVMFEGEGSFVTGPFAIFIALVLKSAHRLQPQSTERCSIGWPISYVCGPLDLFKAGEDLPHGLTVSCSVPSCRTVV